MANQHIRVAPDARDRHYDPSGIASQRYLGSRLSLCTPITDHIVIQPYRKDGAAYLYSNIEGLYTEPLKLSQ